jgi:hypothetical protein
VRVLRLLPVQARARVTVLERAQVPVPRVSLPAPVLEPA